MKLFALIISFLIGSDGGTLLNSIRHKRQVSRLWSEKHYNQTVANINLDLLPTFVTSTPASTTADPCKYNPSTPDFRQPGRRISEAKCFEYMWERTNRENKKKKERECFEFWLSKLNQPFSAGGIGGRNTLAGEFPHMGAVGWKVLHGEWIFKCGCTLISSKFTLTAAHCTKSPRDSSLASPIPEIVRLGDKNIIDNPYNFESPTDAKILRIIKHPLHMAPKKYYDIALLEIAEIKQFTSNLQPACLWGNFETDSLGTSATTTGWGVIETSTRRLPPELQAVVVDIINSEQCDYLLNLFCNRLWCGIEEHQICAGKLAGGVDACQGDSGGPLQMKIPLRDSDEGSIHLVIGVTSFGVGCARPNLPGVTPEFPVLLIGLKVSFGLKIVLHAFKDFI